MRFDSDSNYELTRILPKTVTRHVRSQNLPKQLSPKFGKIRAIKLLPRLSLMRTVWTLKFEAECSSLHQG